jgi:hypothetical protein
MTDAPRWGRDGAVRKRDRLKKRIDIRSNSGRFFELRKVFQTRDVLQPAVPQETGYKYIIGMKMVNKSFFRILISGACIGAT